MVLRRGHVCDGRKSEVSLWLSINGHWQPGRTGGSGWTRSCCIGRTLSGTPCEPKKRETSRQYAYPLLKLCPPRPARTDLSDCSSAEAPLADEEPELDHVCHPERPRLAVPVPIAVCVSERGKVRADELHDLRAQLGLLEDEREPEQRDGETQQSG